ncbi:uncharacterized protein [Nicotiana sylvestris]|uniref:uncharacterized protein n=1 Tax=Nicotiana sylvestris TaxID=4096 RepID=UPI00388CDB1D
MISIHTDEITRDTRIQHLFEFKDVFAWSYDDMPGLSVDLVVHKVPTYPDCPPVQQKQRKFKTDISDKIKEEVTKQLKPGVIRVVLMDEEDAEKIAFTTPWDTYYYKEIEMYVDDVIIKSRTQDDHVRYLRKFFERLRKYDLKLNLAKYAFRVPSGKLLGFIIGRRGIDQDPMKIKSIRDFPPPRTKKEMLKKDAAIKWTDECQEALYKTKEYLSNPPVLVPPEPGRPLFLYLIILENFFGCVLGKHDVTGKKDQTIYYLSKKFTSYEAKYTLLDHLKYIFKKPMPMRRLDKWQILLTEFDIVYVTRTTMKAQALADHLAENPVDDDYQPLSTYFLYEEVNAVKVIPEDTNAWKMFFNGAVNAKGVGIGAILISPTGQHYPAIAQLRFFCPNNTAEYEACIMGMNMAIDQDVKELGEWEIRDVKLIPYRQHVEHLSKWFKSVEFRYVPRFHNELADALATLASILPYPGNVYIDPLEIQIRERHGYCNTVKVESNVQPWYRDIKMFLKTKEYLEQASGDQKRTI